KGLAVELLTKATDAVSGRLSGLRGVEKRELIAAAHSTIVVASVFESFQDQVGQKFYRQLRITDAEKIALVGQMGQHIQEGLVRVLYAAEIPAPSAACGFEENIENVVRWQEEYTEYFQAFIQGLAAAQKKRIQWNSVHLGAIRRYLSRYLELAAKVPEFAI